MTELFETRNSVRKWEDDNDQMHFNRIWQ